ncbi:hypothetical protein N8T08_011115 [Aspergillus melleus]|uniref:Uncharacterized protein n=1 Tax=Aspergillus melleus TaxID=138277 RepID=A0ACC3AQ93_9EURO|nr:hypothetical protein N8T08_011115 [Aspergillus melleus]
MAFMLVTLCCVFATLGSFLFGYDSGVISSTLEQTAFLDRFNHPSDAATGGIVASYNGGAILGSFFASYLSDPYGRRPVMFVGGILASLGAALQAGAATVAMMIAGRLIAGMAIGLMSSIIPVYCSEVSPPRIRGFLGSMQQWMIGLGVVVAQWTGYGCSLHHTGDFTWRFPLALQAVPAVILVAGVWLLPESPRWLIEKGRTEKGRAVLARLHLNRDQSNADLVELEFAEISESITEEQRRGVRSWRQLLCTRATWRRRVLLACGLQAFTQCSGTNVIQNYNPGLYKTLGLKDPTPLMIQGIWGALAQFWNCVFMLFIDRVPRRKLLIPSLLGMGVTMCVEAALAQANNGFADPSANPNAVRAAIAMFFVFSFFFTSIGLISWIYQSEIFPTAIRARGSSLATATNWSLNLVFAQCSPIARTNIGFNYFYCFFAFNWVAAIIVWLFYPETAGKSLEEVEQVFTSDSQVSELNFAPLNLGGDRSLKEDHRSENLIVVRPKS